MKKIFPTFSLTLPKHNIVKVTNIEDVEGSYQTTITIESDNDNGNPRFTNIVNCINQINDFKQKYNAEFQGKNPVFLGGVTIIDQTKNTESKSYYHFLTANITTSIVKNSPDFKRASIIISGITKSTESKNHILFTITTTK